MGELGKILDYAEINTDFGLRILLLRMKIILEAGLTATYSLKIGYE